MAAMVSCIVLLLTGCLAENKLKLAVEASNRQCPFSMGAVGDIESVAYEDGMVIYTLAINEQFANVKAMSENRDDVKRTVMTNYANPEGKLKAMHDLIMDANASVRFVYKGKDSGDSFEVTLTADELKEVEDGTIFTAEDKLNAEIEVTNKQLPMAIDEATVLEKLDILGNSVVYLYKIDESVMSVKDINADAAKGNIRYSLENGGPVVQTFLKKVLDTKRDLRYFYIGNPSGEKKEVVFTTGELQDIIK